jgi:hypothetical protein
MEKDVFAVIEEPGAAYSVVARLVEAGESFGIEREFIADERKLALYWSYTRPDERKRHHSDAEPLGVFIVASDVDKLLGVYPELSWERIGGIGVAASRAAFTEAMAWLEETLAVRTVAALGPRRRPSPLAERALVATA